MYFFIIVSLLCSNTIILIYEGIYLQLEEEPSSGNFQLCSAIVFNSISRHGIISQAIWCIVVLCSVVVQWSGVQCVVMQCSVECCGGKPELVIFRPTSPTNENKQSSSPLEPEHKYSQSIAEQVPTSQALSKIDATVAQKPSTPTLSQVNSTYKPANSSLNIKPDSESAGVGASVYIGISAPGENASNVIPFTYSLQFNINNRYHSLIVI